MAGARELLTRSLGASAADRILLICDETSTFAASCICHVAVSELGAVCEIRRFLLSQQSRAGKQLLASLEDDILRSTAVVLLHSAAASGARFRSVVYSAAGGQDVCTVALPGVTADSLSRFAGTFEIVAERAERIASVMRRARGGELTTRFGAETLVLRFELGEHAPVASGGVAIPGTWRNLPAGEAYVLPNLGTAEGDVAITGSMPGYVVQPGECAVLAFREGEVEPPVRGDREPRRVLERLLFADDGSPRTPGSTAIAELGVGTNHTIERLTGVPFLDQKRLGVVHLGLGDSMVFGGPVASSRHIDVMTAAETLVFDGIPVLVGGRYAL